MELALHIVVSFVVSVIVSSVYIQYLYRHKHEYEIVDQYDYTVYDWMTKDRNKEKLTLLECKSCKKRVLKDTCPNPPVRNKLFKEWKNHKITTEQLRNMLVDVI